MQSWWTWRFKRWTAIRKLFVHNATRDRTYDAERRTPIAGPAGEPQIEAPLEAHVDTFEGEDAPFPAVHLPEELLLSSYENRSLREQDDGETADVTTLAIATPCPLGPCNLHSDKDARLE